jgi:hypothetical protein
LDSEVLEGFVGEAEGRGVPEERWGQRRRVRMRVRRRVYVLRRVREGV